MILRHVCQAEPSFVLLGIEIQVDDMAQSSSREIEESSNSGCIFQVESTGLLFFFFQWLFMGVSERKPSRMTPDKIFGQHLEGNQLE